VTLLLSAGGCAAFSRSIPPASRLISLSPSPTIARVITTPGPILSARAPTGVSAELFFIVDRLGRRTLVHLPLSCVMAGSECPDRLEEIPDYPTSDVVAPLVWSPDGHLAVLVSRPSPDQVQQLVLFHADGPGFDPLTLGNDGAQEASDPAWSPDGHWIAFVGWEASRTDIVVVRADGFETRSLTSGLSGVMESPSWINATTLAFVRVVGSESLLYSVDINSALPTPLALDARNVRDPAASPDGTRIAFVAGDLGQTSLFLANSDGAAGALAASVPNGAASNPLWSPDGQWIAFVVDPQQGQADPALYAVRHDGKDLRRIADVPAWAPVWLPDGRSLIFETLEEGHFRLWLASVPEGAASPLSLPGQLAPQSEEDWMAASWRP